jgi:hypothetical protein
MAEADFASDCDEVNKRFSSSKLGVDNVQRRLGCD